MGRRFIFGITCCILILAQVSLLQGADKEHVLICEGAVYYRHSAPLCVPKDGTLNDLLQSFTSAHQHIPQAAPARLIVTNNTLVRVGTESRAILLPPDGRTVLLGPDSIALLRPGRMPVLFHGSLYSFPPLHAPLPEDIRLRFLPAHPEPGRTCRVVLSTRLPVSLVRLRLQGKSNCIFYPLPEKNGWLRRIARFGIDCDDHSGQLPYQFELVTTSGVVCHLRNSLRYQEQRQAEARIPTLYPWQEKAHSGLTKGILQTTSPARPALPSPPVLKPGEVIPLLQANGDSPAPRTDSEIRIPKLPKLNRKVLTLKMQRLIHKQLLKTSEPRRLWQGRFIYPAAHSFSSLFGEVRYYGRRRVHKGIDIASPFNTPVKAPNHGIVRFVGYTASYGKNIVIDHGQYVFSKIFHMQKFFVKEGQRVQKGQIVGSVGSTGFSTGPHIHWEIWVGNTRVDPKEWVHGFLDQEHSAYTVSPTDRSLSEFLAPRH